MNTFLTDLIPAKARKYVYGLLVLASLVYAAWQANDGDWKQTIGSLFVTLIGLTAVSNTDVEPIVYQQRRAGAESLGDSANGPIKDPYPVLPPLNEPDDYQPPSV